MSLPNGINCVCGHRKFKYVTKYEPLPDVRTEYRRCVKCGRSITFHMTGQNRDSEKSSLDVQLTPPNRP